VQRRKSQGHNSPSVRDAQEVPKRTSRPQRKMTFLIALAGGFLFGYERGVISGAMLSLGREMALSDQQKEIVVSSTVVAALMASLLVGGIWSNGGRRTKIATAAWTLTLGSLLCALAVNYYFLVVGRLLFGAGIGIAQVTIPMYLAEVALPETRGPLVTINALLVTIGQWSAGMMDGLLESQGWRWMLGVAGVPSLIMGIGVGMGLVPESPRWLVAVGRHEDALVTLNMLRVSPQLAQEEWKDIIESSRESLTIKRTENGTLRKVQSMLSNRGCRQNLLIGCGLMWIQQLAGINAVMYYAGTIYEMAGYNEVDAIWLSGYTALALVAGLGLSVCLVERVGRRTLVLTSLGAVTVCLIGLGTSFTLVWNTSSLVSRSSPACEIQPSIFWSGVTKYCFDCVNIEGCGYCETSGVCVEGNDNGPESPNEINECASSDQTHPWIFRTCTNSFGRLSVVFMVLYLFAFGIGMSGKQSTLLSFLISL